MNSFNLRSAALFCLALVLTLVVAPAVQADPSIGRVVKIMGEAKKENSLMAIKQNIRNGDDIYVGDQIVTGEKAFVKILLSDDTLFQLGPKTEFKFEKFSMRGANDRDAVYNLTTGKLRSLFTQKNKEKSLILKTPTVSMGIRGTEILSDVYKRNGEISTDIALMSGKLEITIPQINQQTKTVELMPGQILEAVRVNLPSQGTAGLPNIGKGINSNIKELPKQMMNQLARPENQGGTVFLFDAYRKDLQNSGDIKFSEIKVSEVTPKKDKIGENKIHALVPGKDQPGMQKHMNPIIHPAPKIIIPPPEIVNREIQPVNSMMPAPTPPPPMPTAAPSDTNTTIIK